MRIASSTCSSADPRSTGAGERPPAGGEGGADSPPRAASFAGPGRETVGPGASARTAAARALLLATLAGLAFGGLAGWLLGVGVLTCGLLEPLADRLRRWPARWLAGLAIGPSIGLIVALVLLQSWFALLVLADVSDYAGAMSLWLDSVGGLLRGEGDPTLQRWLASLPWAGAAPDRLALLQTAGLIGAPLGAVACARLFLGPAPPEAEAREVHRGLQLLAGCVGALVWGLAGGACGAPPESGPTGTEARLAGWAFTLFVGVCAPLLAAWTPRGAAGPAARPE